MYELNEHLTCSVSAGYQIFITDEWKAQEANICGLSFGVAGAIFGLIVGVTLSLGKSSFLSKTMSSLMGLTTGSVGGYVLGYTYSWIETSKLTANRWHEVNYIFM